MPIVINEIVITSPPPVAREPYLQIKLEDTLVSSWQTSAAAPLDGEIHIESFSWGVSQLGAQASHFGGRLLTAQDLTGEQHGARGGGTTPGDVVVVQQPDAAAAGATPKEFTVTKKTDTALAGGDDDLLIGGLTTHDDAARTGEVDLNDFNQVRNNFGASGMAESALGDGSVRFLQAGVDAGVW